MSEHNGGWANPGPAGLVAVGIATFCMYAMLTGAVEGSAAAYAGLWLLGGFIVQFPVALIELKEGSVTGGNVFLFFASFFMFVGGCADILGYFAQLQGVVLDGRVNGWAWIILLIALVAWTPAYLKESPAVMGILVCILDAMVFFITFMKLGMFGAAAAPIAANVALAGGILAMYMASGIVLNNAFGKTVLPLGKPILK